MIMMDNDDDDNDDDEPMTIRWDIFVNIHF